jgi:hypothetical protein
MFYIEYIIYYCWLYIENIYTLYFYNKEASQRACYSIFANTLATGQRNFVQLFDDTLCFFRDGVLKRNINGVFG